MCQTVHKEEDYTLRYLMTEKLDAEEPEYIMVETYVSFSTCKDRS